MNDPMWTFDTARPLVAALWQLAMADGYHVALAGSVAYQGYSHKDVDLVFLPMANHEPALANLLVSLRLFFAAEGTPHLAAWFPWEGKRVDVFVMALPGVPATMTMEGRSVEAR
jgi:hypothetical protein